MKWDKPTPPTQMSSDGRYAIQHATENNWVAYAMPNFGKAEELGTVPTDEAARQVCEDHEREMVALRRAG